MNKNITYTGIIVALIAAIFAISNSRHTTQQSAPVLPLATTTAATTSTKTTIRPAQSPADNITLKAAEKTYGGHISNPENALRFMRALSSTTDFVFTGKDYPSLGYFVESIDGKENGDGLYWMLYIDGKSSGVGVSDAIISPGDTIEWRYEKGY